MVKTAILALAIALNAGCDNAATHQLDQLRTENTALRAQLADLTLERDELKFGAKRLLSQAEVAVAKSDWSAVKNLAEDLATRHPATPEAMQARHLLKTAENELAKIARRAEAERAAKIEAENKKRLAEEHRLAAALSKMRKKIDSVENVTWYQDKASPTYTNVSGFYLYFGKRSSGAPWLRLRVTYHADDWLFVESFLVVADGQRFEYNHVNFERDSNTEIWEWYDEDATPRDIAMINAIVSSKHAVIRFNGRQYRRDRTISGKEKIALQNVLDAYKTLSDM